MAKYIRPKLLPHHKGNSALSSITISQFWHGGEMATEEQARNFELLRLAFFVLKLRKLEAIVAESERDADFAFRCNLLRHAIFHQVVTLTRLQAREQALQIITACQHN